MNLYTLIKHVFDTLTTIAFVLLFFASWIGGMVLANGWWKLLAFFFFPYSWYLLLEKYLI